MKAAGWTRVPIGEAATTIARSEKPLAGKIYRQIGVRLWGAGAYEREDIDGSQTQYSAFFRVEPNDIIVNKIWARNGSVAVVPERLGGSYASSEFPIFAPIREKLEPRWFHWITRTRDFWEQCDAKSRGTSGKNRIRPEQFLEVEIPLPSLSEQQRIVARVDALARGVEEARGLRRAAMAEAEAVMRSALIRVFENPRENNIVALNAVSSFQRGRFSHRPRNEPRFYHGEYPFIQINDIPKDRKFITQHSQTLNEEGVKISKMFPSGTLVVSIAATIGAVGILGFDSWMPDSLVGITSDETRTTADYLYYFMRYEQSHLSEIAPASAQKNINIRILNDVKLLAPPLASQGRIVAYLDGLQAKVDELRRLQDETQKELDALMPSILAKAFGGEL